MYVIYLLRVDNPQHLITKKKGLCLLKKSPTNLFYLQFYLVPYVVRRDIVSQSLKLVYL